MGNNYSSESSDSDNEEVEIPNEQSSVTIEINKNFNKWIPDDLDKNDKDFKIKYNLEDQLHNYFITCDIDKIININIKKYSTTEKSKYCKLLIEIHDSIKESEDMIQDILENFPFEYKSNNIEYNFSIQNEYQFSVIENILKVIEFYKKEIFSKTYTLYNYLSDNDLLVNSSIKGFSIRNILESVNLNGVCNISECSTDLNEPSKYAYRKAKYRNMITYERVKQNINDLKFCIDSKIPIIFGISIYQSFYKYEHIEKPKDKEKKIGNFCMILIGYNDEEREWTILNDKEYKISYTYLLDNKLCQNFWKLNI